MSEKLFPLILFEDQHLMVISKPAGLLSQGEITGDSNLVDWARSHVGRNYVGLVHRLDRNTSGIMVLAKRSKAAERLTRDLQQGKIYRSYLAWLEGNLKAEARWCHRLLKNESRNLVQVVSSTHPQGKEAVLTVTPVKQGVLHSRPLTLARFILETGRSHQIRVQAAHEGYPLLGDQKYGRKSEADFPRPALHSHCLRFQHPMSQESLQFEAPLPEDFSLIRSV